MDHVLVSRCRGSEHRLAVGQRVTAIGREVWRGEIESIDGVEITLRSCLATRRD